MLGVREEFKVSPEQIHKLEKKAEDFKNTKESPEFNEYKYFEGFKLRSWVVTFCFLNETGDLYFYPEGIRFNIQEVISINLIIDDSVSDGIKGAIIGNILSGKIGALAGYLTTKSNSVKKIGIRFNIDNYENPVFTFIFLDNPVQMPIGSEHVIQAKDKLQNYISTLMVLDRRNNDSKLFGDL